MRRLWPFLFMIPIALLPLQLLSAGESAAEQAILLSQLMGEESLGIIRIDVRRLDVQQGLSQLPEILRQQFPDSLPSMTQRWCEAFLKAGGTRLDFVPSLVADRLALAVVPLRPGANEQALVDLLKQLLIQQGSDQAEFFATARIDDALVAGTTQAITATRTKSDGQHSRLAEALNQMTGTPIQLIVVPSADQRRIVREMLGTTAVGDQLGRIVADGVEWITLGVDFNPKLRARFTIQTPTNELASQLREMIERELDRGSTGSNLHLGQFLPSQEGRQLLLNLDAGNNAARVLFQSLADRFVLKLRGHRAFENFRKLGSALRQHHDIAKALPASASFDPDGSPRLSWRVHILPYIGEANLRAMFRLNEPWDSPHNRKLIGQMPNVFGNGNWRLQSEGKTTYLVPTGVATAFPDDTGLPFRAISDGLSNTIFLVDAPDERAVIWTKPDDWQVDSDQPVKGLIRDSAGGFWTALGDGEVRFVSGANKVETLRALFTRAGGEKVGEIK